MEFKWQFFCLKLWLGCIFYFEDLEWWLSFSLACAWKCYHYLRCDMIFNNNKIIFLLSFSFCLEWHFQYVIPNNQVLDSGKIIGGSNFDIRRDRRALDIGRDCRDLIFSLFVSHSPFRWMTYSLFCYSVHFSLLIKFSSIKIFSRYQIFFLWILSEINPHMLNFVTWNFFLCMWNLFI